MAVLRAILPQDRLEGGFEGEKAELMNMARYLTPLAKSGYIAVAGGEKNRYLPGKQYRILRKGKAVVRA